MKKPAGYGWRRVVYASELNEDGDCPVCCDVDWTECDCPGPTMDDTEYEWVDGVLWARPEPEPESAHGD